MTTQQQQVKNWMQKFGQETPEKPTIPSDEVANLRLKLIEEETEELAQALFDQNLTETADALADLLYVVLGTAVACGLDLEPIFEEVHRSNESKLWTMSEVKKMLNASPEWKGTATSYRASANYIVKSNEGKVIKSPSFTPPKLGPLIQSQLQ